MQRPKGLLSIDASEVDTGSSITNTDPFVEAVFAAKNGSTAGCCSTRLKVVALMSGRDTYRPRRSQADSLADGPQHR
ncbi:hypothetical protein [Mycolicibacterium goodii]|uniref:hypothetical protein n=1 Tax=Mycolicibacterium goodii TaxID=134601 RepID=UPI001BDC2501|nr:hypothetical protein [Mycolicibacterium goodii]MBU8840495.1 hypothetical protein [Mycolicibacterium goodii]